MSDSDSDFDPRADERSRSPTLSDSYEDGGIYENYERPVTTEEARVEFGVDGGGETMALLNGGEATVVLGGTEHLGDTEALLAQFDTSQEGLSRAARARRAPIVGPNTYRDPTKALKTERRKQVEKEYRAMANPLVPVMMGGQRTEVDPLTVIPGDILILKPGVIVHCDVRVIQASEDLTITSAFLTGNHHEKILRRDTCTHRDRLYSANMIFGQSTIATGKGVGVVVAIGESTLAAQMYTLCKSILIQPRRILPKTRSTRARKLKKVRVRAKYRETLLAAPNVSVAILPVDALLTEPAVCAVWTPGSKETPLRASTAYQPQSNILPDSTEFHSLIECVALSTQATRLTDLQGERSRNIHFQHCVGVSREDAAIFSILQLEEASRIREQHTTAQTFYDVDSRPSDLEQGVSIHTRVDGDECVLVLKGKARDVLERCSSVVINGNSVELDDDTYDACLNYLREYEPSRNLIAYARAVGEVADIDLVHNAIVLGTRRTIRGLALVGIVATEHTVSPQLRALLTRLDTASIRVVLTSMNGLDVLTRAAVQLGMVERQTWSEICPSSGRGVATVGSHIGVVDGRSIDEIAEDPSLNLLLCYQFHPRNYNKLVSVCRARLGATSTILGLASHSLDAPLLQSVDLGVAIDENEQDQWRSTLVLETSDMIIPRDKLHELKQIWEIACTKKKNGYVCPVQ